MANEESICIDYAGRRIKKILPQSVDSKKLIRRLLEINNLTINKEEDLNGYTVFHCKSLVTNVFLQFNIFFSNFKFDLQRPDFININLGTRIENPYHLSLKDNRIIKTLIIGIYVYEKNDIAENAIFVTCPIKDRDYAGNPSLRPRIELVQEARKQSDAEWVNNAGDKFRAFKPMNFTQIFNLQSLGNKNVAVKNNATITVHTRKKPGPKPFKGAYTTTRENHGIGYVYLARWGEKNIWKIGMTTNPDRRFKEFNKYIPIEEDPSTDIWTLYSLKNFESEDIAYDVEQDILCDKKLKEYNTSGERFCCDFDLIKKIIDDHVIKYMNSKI